MARNRLYGVMAAFAVLLCLVALPDLASAQQIGGTVTDTTAGVLPGVTVEARSPATIEEVRTVVTDGAGQYLIVALESGTYTVTYTLPGFGTFVREGIVLTSGFTANVDVQLSVGDIQESVTVSGDSPVVDIQNVVQRAVVDREVMDSIPSGKSISNYGLLIPGMSGSNSYGSTFTQDAGGMGLQGLGTMAIHGGHEGDQVLSINGMEVGDPFLQGASVGYFPDTSFEEMAFSYSGNSADMESGGVNISMIPREGSNSFSSSVFTTFSFSDMLTDNLDQDLLDRGLLSAPGLQELWTIAPSFGGPIVEDRLWFFVTHSSQMTQLLVPNVFFAVDPAAFVYEPDTSRPSPNETRAHEQSLNLTFQATSKDKVKAYWSNTWVSQPHILQGRALGSIFLTPEAAFNTQFRTNTYQATWTRPHTNRLLFEAGFSHMPISHQNYPTDEAVQLPGILEIFPVRGHRNTSSFLGQTYRNSVKKQKYGRGSMSYVTGSHNLKVGFTFLRQDTGVQTDHFGDWQSFTTAGGIPFSVRFDGATNTQNIVNTLGIYAQNQWTLDRLTVTAGVRLDFIDGYYPDQTRLTNIWIPTPFSVPGLTATAWKDFQPRLGAAYDLRGDGKTALKFSANRYGKRDSTDWVAAINPAGNNIRMDRSWFDGNTGNPFLGIPFGSLPSCIGTVTCIPGDGVVQGDPLNDYPNGEIVSFNTTPEFGIPAITAFFDPDWAFGWGNREANWEFSGSIQQELFTGVSLDVGYFRRMWINREVVVDRALTSADFEVATFTAPTDPLLPDGGGGTLSFYDLRPGSVRVPDELTTHSNNFGGESENWQGFDITMDARLENILLQGGVSTGRVARDFCDSLGQLPEFATSGRRLPVVGGSSGGQGDTAVLEWCNRSEKWLTQLKLLGSYSLPYDIQLAATLQNQPGPQRLALMQIAGQNTSLGRSLTGVRSRQVNIVEPGSMFGPRFSQVDFRVTKIFDFGSNARFRAMFDLFNVFNANAVVTENLSYPGNWLEPQAIMPGRLGKFAFQIDF